MKSRIDVRMLNRIFGGYFGLLDGLFSNIFGLGLPGSVIQDLLAKPSGTIDERLSKIEAAKQNLIEIISALDELKAEADQNKEELKAAIDSLKRLKKKKTATKNELDSLQKVADVYAAALKKLFGVPTQGRIWRERFYGLLTGVLAIIYFSWQRLGGVERACDVNVGDLWRKPLRLRLRLR